ncbi:hypothetical protein Fmac_001004 [Flemingia macrophylla]|uniref:PCI domain-containing protein n=1 Tax=Flemingia macrophylla TaxID=520843 RepID=A0ABD1NFW9_9FABA
MEVEEEHEQEEHLVLATNLFLLSHHCVSDIDKVHLKDEVLTYLKHHGESLGTSQGDRKPDSGSWPEDRPGVLHIAAWFFDMDFDLIAKSIEKARSLFEEGGHWERKNQLKVYEGLVSLKQKLVDAPEILTVIDKIPYLSDFLNSLYDCQYQCFFTAFGEQTPGLFWFTEKIKLDRYLHPHFRYYMREVRTTVYSQYLESYKSVTIDAMAKAFRVTLDFIDLEVSRFIASGRLHCKIDRLSGVLETNRPDGSNTLYQATIKQGHFLLNRIQKLSRVIDL